MLLFHCYRPVHNDEDEYVINKVLLQDLVLWRFLLLGQLGLPWGKFIKLKTYDFYSKDMPFKLQIYTESEITKCDICNHVIYRSTLVALHNKIKI